MNPPVPPNPPLGLSQQGRFSSTLPGEFTGRTKPLVVPPGFTTSTPKPSSSQNLGQSKFEPEQQVTSDHLMQLMTDSKSSTASSGYNSALNLDENRTRLLVKRVSSLQEILNKTPTQEDCETMRLFLLQFGGRTAFKNHFKGPDSFFYCLARACPNISNSSDPQTMVAQARSGLSSFATENKQITSVSFISQFL